MRPYDLPPRETWPQPGYYYHYKHDPSGPVNNYAYYIHGVGHHTEEDCRPQDLFTMVYQPLYPNAFVYKQGRMYDIRPLHMFFEPAKLKDEEVTRFVRITDPVIIAVLQGIKREMYPPHENA